MPAPDALPTQLGELPAGAPGTVRGVALSRGASGLLITRDAKLVALIVLDEASDRAEVAEYVRLMLWDRYGSAGCRSIEHADLVGIELFACVTGTRAAP